MSKVLGAIRFVCGVVALAATLICASVAAGGSPGLAQAGEDVELRLRRAAQALVSAEEEVAGLQTQLERERVRVVGSEVERDLNRDTIARLQQALVAARSRQVDLKADVERLQKEREASVRPLPATPVAPVPAAAPAAKPEPIPRDLTRAVQSELGRLGCDAGAPDGVWGPASQLALQEYNRHNKSNHQGPTAVVLEELRERKSRICPLTCRVGFKLDGDRCVAVSKPSNIDDDELFSLTVCNKDGNMAVVAVSAPRKPQGDAVVSGWYQVRAGECKIVGRWAQGTVYWLALDFTNNKNGWRGKDLTICVPQAAFSRVRSGNYTCASNEKLESFHKIFVSSKNYTLNLNP